MISFHIPLLWLVRLFLTMLFHHALIYGVPATIAPYYTCGAALAYLHANQYPGVVDYCPAATPTVSGALGETLMTYTVGTPRIFVSGEIYIADPCPNVYRNEASNSWVLMGLSNAPIDPYGAGCHN